MNRLSPILFAAALLALAGLALAAPPEPGPEGPRRDAPRLEQARQQFQQMQEKIEKLQQEVQRLRAALDGRRGPEARGPQAGPAEGRGPAREMQVERRMRLRFEPGMPGEGVGPREGRPGPQAGPEMRERAQRMEKMRQMSLKFGECRERASRALQEGRFEEAAKASMEAAKLQGMMTRMREEWAGQQGADRPRGPGMRGQGRDAQAPMRAMHQRLEKLEQRMERIENLIRKLAESRRADRD